MREKRSRHFGLGMPSLVVIFATLCLTVLALLSWQTARNEAVLAARDGEAARAYYAADAQARHIRRALETDRADTVRGVPVVWDGDEARFTCPVDDALVLSVALRVGDGGSEVLAWNTAPTGDWTPDTHIEVWEGGAARGS